MGHLLQGKILPQLGSLMDARILCVSFLLVLCEGAKLLDFPGPISCLDDGIQITKPGGINWRSWRTASIVDSKGVKAPCGIEKDGNLLTVPKLCLNHESGSMVAYLSFNKKKPVYKIACPVDQADSPLASYDGPIIECGKDIMTVKISRMMPAFSDEHGPSPPVATWLLNVESKTFTLPEASTNGYTLDDKTDKDYYIIKVKFDAYGIRKESLPPPDDCLGQNFYRGDLQLVYGGRRKPKLVIDVTVVCAEAHFDCKETMKICIPPLGGVISNAEVNGNLSVNEYGVTIYQNNTVTFESKTFISVPGSSIKVFPWNLTLVLEVDDFFVPMSFTPECSDGPNPRDYFCKDGMMRIEVFYLQTTPALNLSTVKLGDGQCKATGKTDNSVIFYFPVATCGTTLKFVDGKLMYEIEVHALWIDSPRRISRDSELRETVRCLYNASDDKQVTANVVTQSAPAVSDGYGPLTLVLNLYQDVTYKEVYGEERYPLVKTLRDPIFFEVQVLNRNDPDIELVLDDCWATMSKDPTATPQWNVVVDGCQENQDDYPTIFHSVSNVALPRHRKRFEVKAFAFWLDSDVSSKFVYFHCSAVICNVKSPDFSVCTKGCVGSRRKRDELFLQRHSILASLPGPVYFEDSGSERVMNMQDESDVIKQITLGILPAFGLVALIVLLAVLVPLFKRKLQH